MDIEPINYQWNKKSGLETEGMYTGFSAQNIKEFIPEAVGEGPNGYLTLSDRPILAATVNAIKQQQTEISGSLLTLSEMQDEMDEIKEELEDQEDLTNELQSQIAELERITNEELKLAQTELNTTEIAEIKLALGIEYEYDEDKNIKAVNLGMTDLIGKLKSEELETGKLVINISDEEQASIGEAVIEAGESSVVISQDNISEDSRIFITPRIATEQSLAVTDISDGEFTVEVAEVLEDELPFDWWIVEIEE